MICREAKISSSYREIRGIEGSRFEVRARFELARVRVIEAGEAYKLYASLVLRVCVANICSCLKRG